MKSGDAYRFCLSWPMATEEQILAGEFLGKLGNKKSRFIIGLICDYLSANPEALDPKEAVQFVIKQAPIGEQIADMIKSIIKAELAGKVMIQQNTDSTDEPPGSDEDINSMFENLNAWNL